MTTLQHVTSHRWRVSARPFTVVTSDEVRLEGTRLGPPGHELPAIVAVHGLMGWHRKPQFAQFAERLTPWFTVYAFDTRGHGDSEGISDFGGEEMHDVEAVVDMVRDVGHPALITMGTSMGAIAVLRHAGLIKQPDMVVSVSSLAYWDWHGGADPVARRNFHARVGTSAGRAALRAYGVRLPDSWEEPESPEDIVAAISPTPLVIVHGSDDRLFSVDHAHRLFDAALEPKKLMIGDGFGHAEEGLTSAFARRISGEIHRTLELPWSV